MERCPLCDLPLTVRFEQSYCISFNHQNNLGFYFNPEYGYNFIIYEDGVVICAHKNGLEFIINGNVFKTEPVLRTKENVLLAVDKYLKLKRLAAFA
jgi:hypothetical protein